MIENTGMKSIWYFVGLILMTMGAVVTLSGIYYLFSPTNHHTVLSHLHPNLWWGGMMIVAGFIFFITNRKHSVE